MALKAALTWKGTQNEHSFLSHPPTQCGLSWVGHPGKNSTHTARWICRTNVWGEGLRPGPDLPLDASRMAGSGHGDGPVRLLFATMPTSNNIITV